MLYSNHLANYSLLIKFFFVVNAKCVSKIDFQWCFYSKIPEDVFLCFVYYFFVYYCICSIILFIFLLLFQCFFHMVFLLTAQSTPGKQVVLLYEWEVRVYDGQKVNFFPVFPPSHCKQVASVLSFPVPHSRHSPPGVSEDFFHFFFITMHTKSQCLLTQWLRGSKVLNFFEHQRIFDGSGSHQRHTAHRPCECHDQPFRMIPTRPHLFCL